MVGVSEVAGGEQRPFLKGDYQRMRLCPFFFSSGCVNQVNISVIIQVCPVDVVAPEAAARPRRDARPTSVDHDVTAPVVRQKHDQRVIGAGGLPDLSSI